MVNWVYNHELMQDCCLHWIMGISFLRLQICVLRMESDVVYKSAMLESELGLDSSSMLL